ncbi:MAG: hypothetical protein WAV90_19270 [Gordonia amarae]
MVPETALKLIRAITSEVLGRRGHRDIAENTRLVELAESVDALDHWLSSGGQLPTAWSRAR